MDVLIKAAYIRNKELNTNLYFSSRFFYASSACIYPEFKQLDTNVSLKEADAWPAEVFPPELINFILFYNYIHFFHNSD